MSIPRSVDFLQGVGLKAFPLHQQCGRSGRIRKKAVWLGPSRCCWLSIKPAGSRLGEDCLGPTQIGKKIGYKHGWKHSRDDHRLRQAGLARFVLSTSRRIDSFGVKAW